jgi:hypothetical protein
VGWLSTAGSHPCCSAHPRILRETSNMETSSRLKSLWTISQAALVLLDELRRCASGASGLQLLCERSTGSSFAADTAPGTIACVWSHLVSDGLEVWVVRLGSMQASHAYGSIQRVSVRGPT